MKGLKKNHAYTKSPNLPSPFWSKTVGQELLGWPLIRHLNLNSAQKMKWNHNAAFLYIWSLKQNQLTDREKEKYESNPRKLQSLW